MRGPGERYRARPGLVLSAKGEAHFLTDLGTGQVWELNGTAAFIFEAASRGQPVAEVGEALAARHPEVPRGELERDLAELLDDLLRLGVLEPLPGP